MCEHRLGQIDTALTLYQRCLALVPDERSRGTTLNNISQIYDARGDYEQALQFLEQSLLIQRQIGDKAGMIATLHNMTSIALGQRRDLDGALAYWGEAFQLAMETRNALGIFHVAGTLGGIFAQMGQKDQARQLLQMAVEVGRQAGLPGVEELAGQLRGLEARECPMINDYGHQGLAPNATYFVAARREPSGIAAGKPGGLRRSANKSTPNGSKVSGSGLTPLATSCRRYAAEEDSRHGPRPPFVLRVPSSKNAFLPPGETPLPCRVTKIQRPRSLPRR